MQSYDINVYSPRGMPYIRNEQGTERGPDIVRMPSMGQKRTISGMRTISEGHKIPMVVMLFICYNEK